MRGGQGRFSFGWAAAALFVLWAASGAWAQVPQGNSCVACHADDIWQDVKSSIHAERGIFCNHCHGGDPTKADQKLAKAPETGYIGIPDKKQIVEKCGQCHADVEFMNPYGTRTDQLARYKTSSHGKRLFHQGDEKAPVCSDCHGYHDVAAVSDPNSRVYPPKVPETCNRCHEDAKLMSAYGHPTDVFVQYRKSVHGKALFDKGDLGAPHCASCHGSHGAVPPGVKEVGAACGKCHLNENKFFLESVHAPAAREGKFSECVSCHGNHGVQPASAALYEEACAKCHEQGSSAFEEGRKIAQVLRKANDDLAKAEALVKQASIEGFFVEEEEASLEEARTHVIAMGPLQHTLSLKRISEFQEKAAKRIEEVEGSVRKKRESSQWRKLALIPIWIFILVMAGALWIKYKRLTGEHRRNGNAK